MTFRPRHLAAALLLHVALIVLLVSGAQCSAKVTRPPPIQGVLLDPSRQEAAAQKKREADEREAQRKKAEAEKKKREEELARQQEEQRKQKELADRKKAAAEALKQKQAADARRKADEAKKLADRKKTDDAAKKKKEQLAEKERQEAAQRDLQDKARLEDELRQEQMKRQADKEAEARAESEREQKQALWAAQLSRAVARQWIRPTTVTGTFSCKVHVALLPSGDVSSASVQQSCGSSALDKSVEDAVLRASPLPKPSDPSIFDRDLIINFIPESQ